MVYRVKWKSPGFWPGLFSFYFNCSGLEETHLQRGCLLFCFGCVILGLDMGFCQGIWATKLSKAINTLKVGAKNHAKDKRPTGTELCHTRKQRFL
jgi:hypothetical protein